MISVYCERLVRCFFAGYGVFKTPLTEEVVGGGTKRQEPYFVIYRGRVSREFVCLTLSNLDCLLLGSFDRDGPCSFFVTRTTQGDADVIRLAPWCHWHRVLGVTQKRSTPR